MFALTFRADPPSPQASTENIVFALLGSPSGTDLHELRDMGLLPTAGASLFVLFQPTYLKIWNLKSAQGIDFFRL